VNTKIKHEQFHFDG